MSHGEGRVVRAINASSDQSIELFQDQWKPFDSRRIAIEARGAKEPREHG